MDEIIGSDQFMITFPLWILLHPMKRVEACIRLGGPSGEIATPLFTDKDLVDRFHEENPTFSHYALGCIQDPATLLPLLQLLEQNGFTHVTIDHTKRGAMFFPIDQLRAIASGR